MKYSSFNNQTFYFLLFKNVKTPSFLRLQFLKMFSWVADS